MIKKIAGLISLIGIASLTAVLVIFIAQPPEPEKILEIWKTFQIQIVLVLFIFLLSATIVSVSTLFAPTPHQPETPASQLSNKNQTEPATAQPAQSSLETPSSPPCRCSSEQKEPQEQKEATSEAAAKTTDQLKLVDEKGIPLFAYQILHAFQKEGRLLDFLMEDISQVDDATLGGAIRPIHEGCRKILQERLIIEPVLDKAEGEEIVYNETVDPDCIKLSGNVPAHPPYKGSVIHRGWRLKECKLPQLVSGWTGGVVAPAEIEIP